MLGLKGMSIWKPFRNKDCTNLFDPSHRGTPLIDFLFGLLIRCLSIQSLLCTLGQRRRQCLDFARAGRQYFDGLLERLQVRRGLKGSQEVIKVEFCGTLCIPQTSITMHMTEGDIAYLAEQQTRFRPQLVSAP